MEAQNLDMNKATNNDFEPQLQQPGRKKLVGTSIDTTHKNVGNTKSKTEQLRSQATQLCNTYLLNNLMDAQAAKPSNQFMNTMVIW